MDLEYIRKSISNNGQKKDPKNMVWWDCNIVLGGKTGPSKVALFLVPKTSDLLDRACIKPSVAGCLRLGAAIGDCRLVGDGCMPSGPGREAKRHKG